MTQSSTTTTTSKTATAPRRDHPLYIFTTSQTPLAARYPRPTKPTLNVPPLIHRSLHQALDQTPPSLSSTTTSPKGITIPHPDHLRKHDIPVAPEHDEVELTLKIHLVGEGSAEERSQWVQDALALLDTHLGLGGADTLLVGFKGVDYKGKKTETETDSAETNGVPAIASEYSVSPGIESHIIEFWSLLTTNLRKGDRKTKVKNLGTMYLPLGLLKRLKEAESESKPDSKSESGTGLVINSLDTPDCHHLPKDFTGWAKENEVQLWAGGGGEGSDPLPSAELHNILQEFASHLLPTDSQSKAQTALTRLIPLDENGKWDDSAPRGVDVRWVLGYTVVSSTRNVVEDKGYVVAADLVG